MQFHTKSRSCLFHLPLIVCLTSGILGYAPIIALANVARADPPPPPVEGATMEEVMESQPALDTQQPSPTPAEARRADEQAERGEALDLAMDEIVEAQEQLTTVRKAHRVTAPTADHTVGNGCTYATIAAAISAADPGDTLLIEGGRTFTENLTIGISLTLEGGYDGCASGLTAATTIDGSTSPDSVFYITDSQVVLRNLNITGGNADNGGGARVLGTSQVTLDNTDVFSNNATNNGGGIYLNPGCTVTITNDSDIYNNTALGNGGGVRVWGKFVGNDWDSTISNNTAPDGGGVSVPGGVLYLDGSHVRDNSATDPVGRGGGIHVYDSGVVTATGSSNVSHNDAYYGAGIYADDASVRLSAVVHSNVATFAGGGVYLFNDSTIRATETYIGYSAASFGGNDAVHGAGIYAITSTVNFDGYIFNNLALTDGAGIYADNSTINLDNAQVGGTGDYEANRLSGSVTYGGGLYLTNGTRATLNNTTVSSNTFPVTGTTTFGGGAYLRDGSALTLTNSTIERHLAPSISQGRGAGIYAQDSTVTLNNSRVISNTAGTVGGGVRTWNTTILNILNGSELNNNHALNGEGGAVAATGSPTITILNSTLQHNSANTDGGAIYLDTGTLDLNDQWDIRWNHADGNGGAVAVLGTGDVDMDSNGGNSYLNVNTASGNGGALYVGNNDYVELYVTSSYQINLNLNSASGDGGAVYANSGAIFDVRGHLTAASNSADGNGGVFYLGSGSQLWLDSYNDNVPLFRNNWADNGGAIYASNSPGISCDGAEFGSAGSTNRATSGSGGAIYLSGSDFDAVNCTFRNSQATGNGGAVAAYTSTVTIDANYSTCDPLSGQCSSFYDNTADSDNIGADYGGAIYVDDSTLSLDHTHLHRNRAYRGGAIYQVGANASSEVNNSLFYSNTVDTNTGAAIRVVGGSFTATHMTLANNPSPAAPAYSASAGTINVANSIAWGNETGGFDFGSASVITSCNIDQSGNAGIAVNPQFVSPGAGENYHLMGSSPAVDQCPTGLPTDLDNVSRPFGGGYDMGAYEYANGVELAPDRSGSSLSPSVAMYTHTLTNTGGGEDTFIITAQSDQGWPVTIIPISQVTLGSGISTPITVSLTIPAGVLSGTVNTTVVTATSTGDPYLTARVTETTAVFTTNLPTYTLAVNVVGNGSVTRSPSQTTYISGTVVQLEAIPDTGWNFVAWSGALTGNTNPDSITMDGDKEVTATFTVGSVCTEVTGVSLVYTNTGTIYTDTVVYFSADIAPDDADRPYTYTVDYGSGPGTPTSSSDDPLTFDQTFATTGTHTVEIAVWNCEMTSTVTDDFSFTVQEQGVCVDLAGITIAGATSGTPGTYTFTTSYEPLDASIPITYAWDNGDTTATSVRTLSVGTTTLMVTATNICATVTVTDTHEIFISNVGYDIYLPLVMRN